MNMLIFSASLPELVGESLNWDLVFASIMALTLIWLVAVWLWTGRRWRRRIEELEAAIEAESAWPEPAEKEALQKDALKALAAAMGDEYRRASIVWGQSDSSNGQPLFTLRLQAAEDAAEAAFPASELRSPSRRQVQMLRLWSDLLTRRSRRIFENTASPRR